MKPYDQLTHIGKLRRQRPFARAALSQYPLTVRRADLVSSDTNLIYRVLTGAGERYALRLVFPGWRSLENLQSEAMWLAALAKDTDLRLPRLVPTLEGELVASAGSELDGRPRFAVLMHWLPGRLLGKHLTPANLQKMGALFARLHIHGREWTPTAGFSNQKFERYLSRGERNRLFSDAFQARLPPNQRRTLSRMQDRVEAAYAGLDRADLRVIHCDLWHDNIKLHKGELAPFDFEDTIWGFRLHDIAMAMLDLAEEVGTANYYRLLAAFRRGYEQHLDWPEGSLETLQMGRVLWRLNWMANFAPDYAPKAIAVDCLAFNRFEKTGKLSDPVKGW